MTNQEHQSYDKISLEEVKILNRNLEALVKLLKQGDETAFPKLYNETYRQLFFVVLPIIRDKSLAEDIIQDTYLKFLEKLSEYQAKNVFSYLITIAKNLAINEYNRRKKTVKIDDFNEFSYYDHVEIKEEMNEAILKALAILERDEKDVFLLHVLENLTHKEIAAIMEKPMGTISWLYAKAIKKMKIYLKEEKYEY
ncbi:MAG: RNA polymerase sigma factor [Candidatus Izemoplasmatales bacterium]|nr:RNA polymerase sigma factor [Candidatus Izemoplasmatales bacterium]